MVQPIDYISMTQGQRPNIAEQFMSGLKAGASFRAVSQQQEAEAMAKRQQEQYAADLQMALQNPSQSMFGAMIAKYPGQREAFRDAAKLYGEDRIEKEFWQGAEISNALESGNIPVAKQRVETILQARKNSGMPGGIYQQIFDAIENGNPKGAQAATNFALSAADPDRFQKMIKSRLDAENMPSAITKAGAEASRAVIDVRKAGAEADKAEIEAKFAERFQLAGLDEKKWNIKNISSQIGDRAARLNLDKQTTAATVAEKLASIGKMTTDIPADTRKAINDAAAGAGLSMQAADQFASLADRLEREGGGYGVASSASEWVKKVGGMQGGMTALRQEYVRLRNQAAIKSLPPGPATDRDIELALKGFPTDTADAASIASFLRGVSKLQKIEGAVSNAKADWLANNNGALTRAKSAFIAGDFAARPGETFADFSGRIASTINERGLRAKESPAVRQIPTEFAPTPQVTEALDIRSRADAILSGGR